MLGFLLLNWKWLAPTVAAIALSAALGVSRIEVAHLQASWAQERANAEHAAAAFAARSAAKDAANADLSRDLEATRAKAIADDAAGRDAFAERLRRATLAARRGCMPTATPAASGNAEPAAGNDDGRGAIDPGLRLREVIKTLQADVKLCWAWGASVGR